MMMTGLLSLMIVLALHGMFLDGGTEGLKFYLLPDFGKSIRIHARRTCIERL